jgi:hypothetical protein
MTKLDVTRDVATGSTVVSMVGLLSTDEAEMLTGAARLSRAEVVVKEEDDVVVDWEKDMAGAKLDVEVEVEIEIEMRDVLEVVGVIEGKMYVLGTERLEESLDSPAVPTAESELTIVEGTVLDGVITAAIEAVEEASWFAMDVRTKADRRNKTKPRPPFSMLRD